MNNPLLVIDAHYLCHRAWHSSRHLAYRGMSTGVLFGFMRTIMALRQEFNTSRVAFCFEGKTLHRKKLFSGYKQHRHKTMTAQEQQEYKGLRVQIDYLRTKLLKDLGFRNIFCEDGFESDDLMAALARATAEDDHTILVTADGDLLQCLRPNVSVYNPHKEQRMTAAWFHKEHGISPKRWALVKALAGCKGDGVPGIKGVGEITALRFVRNELPQGSTAYDLIMSGKGKATVRRNRLLVELPFKGCPTPRLREDSIAAGDWYRTCMKLGMKTLAKTVAC